MGRGEFALGKIYEIEHIGGKAKSVAKLFDKYTSVDGKQTR